MYLIAGMYRYFNSDIWLIFWFVWGLKNTVDDGYLTQPLTTFFLVSLKFWLELSDFFKEVLDMWPSKGRHHHYIPLPGIDFTITLVFEKINSKYWGIKNFTKIRNLQDYRPAEANWHSDKKYSYIFY